MWNEGWTGDFSNVMGTVLGMRKRFHANIKTGSMEMREEKGRAAHLPSHFLFV